MIPASLAAHAGRRVLVTGHTGFKGSWLCLVLHRIGARVAGYALAAEEGSLFEALGLESRLSHVEGDVRDGEHLARTLEREQPEIVFHLAAQSLLRPSYDDPVGTFSTNVMGTVHLLEAVRSTPSVRALVVVTSDKCYLDRGWDWGYRENDRLGGRDPYSASKAAAELAFAAFAASFLDARDGLGAASARAGNVVGGGDWAKDRLVPDCIRALRRGEPVRLRNPGSTRPWQHVLDCLSGYLLLAERLVQDPRSHAGAWNFGPDDRDIRTVEEVARRVIDAWGSGSLALDAPDPARPEASTLHLACEKAHRRLGWSPRWGFDRSMAETAAWYRDVAAGADALEVSSAQIERYFRDPVLH